MAEESEEQEEGSEVGGVMQNRKWKEMQRDHLRHFNISTHALHL